MTRKEYNGWTNYETWLVKLWMDNEEGYWREQAEENVKADEDGDIASLAAALKDQHEEIIHEALPKHLQASFMADLLGAAMSEVNWDEIASSLIDDAKEALKDEDEPQPTKQNQISEAIAFGKGKE